MPEYTQMQAFETGQVLGRSQLNILRDNDNYFNAIAARWIPCLHGPSVGGTPGQVYTTIWEGYHLLRADATYLGWLFIVSGGSSTSSTMRFLYYKDNGDAYEVAEETAAANQTETVIGALDLSTVDGITAGLHQVRFRLESDAGDPGAGMVRPPYTTMYGNTDYTFTIPPVVHDGDVGEAAHFNAWRANDEYFYHCLPTNPAFSMISKGDPTNGTGEIIWDGWSQYHDTHRQLNYRLKYSGDDNDNRLIIYYDYNGSNETYGTMDTPEEYVESSLELPASTYTENGWYRVVVEEQHTGGNPAAYTWVDYLYMSPLDDLVVSNLMGAFTPGYYVLGDTENRDRRLSLFTSWDNSLLYTLCSNSNVGRRDFAVRDDAALGPYDPISTHRLIHMYDFLWYRGTGIALRWGTDNVRSLEDAATDAAVMDLRAITGLAYGQHYTLDGNVDFAMEAVYNA